jgi:hypothetical protein
MAANWIIATFVVIATMIEQLEHLPRSPYLFSVNLVVQC